MQDLDREKVEAYLHQRSTRQRHPGRFEDIEQVFVGMECATVTNDGKVVPTNAGIVFFGREPKPHIIQSEVVCVLFRDAVGASRYADRILTGALQEVIDGAEAFLKR